MQNLVTRLAANLFRLYLDGSNSHDVSRQVQVAPFTNSATRNLKVYRCPACMQTEYTHHSAM